MSTEENYSGHTQAKHQTKLLRELQGTVKAIDDKVGEILDEVKDISHERAGYSSWSGQDLYPDDYAE